MQDSVFVVRAVTKSAESFTVGWAFSHCNAQSGIFDHGYIVIAVAAADHFICSHSQAVEQLLKGSGLVDILGHDFKERMARSGKCSEGRDMFLSGEASALPELPAPPGRSSLFTEGGRMEGKSSDTMTSISLIRDSSIVYRPGSFAEKISVSL